MDAWFWVGVIGVTLLLVLVILIALGVRLFRSGIRFLRAAEGAIGALEALEAKLAEPVEIEPVKSSYGLDLDPILKRRLALVEARREKARARQRRLIARLKNINYDEGRFR